MQIKVYSVPDGVRNQHFVDFINPNYFRVKGNDDENYKIILTIFKVLIPYPVTSMVLLIALTVHYIYPLMYKIVFSYATAQNPNSQDSQPDSRQGSPSDSSGGATSDGGSKVEDQQIKFLTLLSLLLTNVTMTMALICIYVASIAKHIEYGNEVLYNQPFGDSNSDDQAIPIIHAVISLLTMLVSLILVTMIYMGNIIHKRKESRRDDYEKVGSNHPEDESPFHKAVAVSITLNIIYLGSYYSPYMVVAFIHDPIRTSLIYFLLICVVICLYLFFLGSTNLVYLCFKVCIYKCKGHNKLDTDCYYRCTYCIEGWTAVISATYLAIIIVYLFVLGSFDSLNLLQSLTLPLMIFLFSYLFLKPLLKSFKRSLNNDKGKNAQ